MLQPLEMVVQQVSKTDQQLIYHLIIEQKETNRLLNLLIDSKQVGSEDEVKRPELMRRMSRLKDKPMGWNKWSNDQIIEHLKGVG